MGWKDLSYKVKSGIILGLISIALNIIILISVYGNRDGGLVFAWFNFPMTFFIDLIEELFNFSGVVPFIIVFLTAAVWFIVGFIIGFIIDKIKVIKDKGVNQ